MLSRLYRGKFLALMEAAYREGRLRGFDHESEFHDWRRSLFRHEWVVYAKAPMAGPQVVLKYLARYTHRVAIANQRLIGMDGQSVTFAYKDYRQNSRVKSMTLSGGGLRREDWPVPSAAHGPGDHRRVVRCE